MKLDFKVQVPYKLQRFLTNPTPYIEKTLRAADKQALTLLKADVAKAAPKQSGKLSRSITVDIGKRKVFSPLIYARAVELGHYAEPVRTPKKMFLKFVGQGREVFLKYTRSKKHPYFFLTLDRDRLKILEIYDKAFKKLLESV
jgi:hypothetical protein